MSVCHHILTFFFVSTEVLSHFYNYSCFGMNSDQWQIQICLTLNSNKMAVNVKPLADRVLVEPAPAEETTASGIIIPDTAKEKPQRGKIIAVGGGKKDEPLTVSVGDTVLYGKYSGTEINLDGKDYLIMRESDIFAIV